MKRIYIGGAYNADNIVDALNNMRKGMRLGTKVLLRGYCPFVPWFDYHFQLNIREWEKLTIDDYYRYSFGWLEVSDALLLVPGWEESKGTLMEIEYAREHDIPIFYDIKDLEV